VWLGEGYVVWHRRAWVSLWRIHLSYSILHVVFKRIQKHCLQQWLSYCHKHQRKCWIVVVGKEYSLNLSCASYRFCVMCSISKKIIKGTITDTENGPVHWHCLPMHAWNSIAMPGGIVEAHPAPHSGSPMRSSSTIFTRLSRRPRMQL